MLLVLALLLLINVKAFRPLPRMRPLFQLAVTEVDESLNQYAEMETNPPWQFYVLDDAKLPAACAHLVDCFYKEPEALSSRLLNANSPFEKSVYKFLLHWHYQLTKLDTLGHSLTHSLTHLLTHLLTHSLRSIFLRIFNKSKK